MKIRNLTRYLLRNRLEFKPEDWTVQGFGFMRLRVDDSTRLHIWDSRLRVPEVSDVHDHTQWAFTSYVMSGLLVNVRYEVLPADSGAPDRAQPFSMATIQCGIGGGMKSSVPETVLLLPQEPEAYGPGNYYEQEPDEVHRTFASDGTVTLLDQRRVEADTARVFWPAGSQWGNATPRVATRQEVDAVGAYALAVGGWA